jgi:hypothetical protein
MLNKSVSCNKDVAQLTNELGGLAGLLWTWMIAHLDREGRMHGDPEVIKGTVCPRIAGVTPDLIRQTAARAQELGLIVWYEVDGESYIEFPGFAANQPHMRKEREQESLYPAPGSEGCRMLSGSGPDEVRSKSGSCPAEWKGSGIEGKWKGREGKVASSPSGSQPPLALKPVSPVAIELPTNTGEASPVTDAEVSMWSASFPAVDVPQALREMRAWLDANPDRRKTKRGMRAFVVRWLGREQDKGGNGHAARAGPRGLGRKDQETQDVLSDIAAMNARATHG